MRTLNLETLIKKIRSKQAKIGIVGLGYVGLPLAVEFAKSGFKVVGVDVDQTRIAQIQKGKSYILDVPSEDVAREVARGRLTATRRPDVYRSCDAVIICVPTPLRKTRDPDISYIVSAVQAIAKGLHRNQLVVLESTTYPGTTEEVLQPILEESGLKAGRDFGLAFSPERVDPGNKHFFTRTIPKVVGGLTPSCTQAAAALYGQVIDEVISVSSPKCAEMVKLLENSFRSVNIGLANELALVCNRMGVDAWEVIDAAKSKPFGFMPFYPGPGLGGHCLPIDPLYLSWKAKMHGYETRFIDLAAQINSAMPHYVVNKAAETLNTRGRALKGAKIFVLGVTYKRNVNDIRESPALEIISHLIDKGAQVVYHDPYVPAISLGERRLLSVPLTSSALRKADLVLIVTDHTAINYAKVLEQSRCVFDTRGVIRQAPSAKLVRL